MSASDPSAARSDDAVERAQRNALIAISAARTALDLLEGVVTDREGFARMLERGRAATSGVVGDILRLAGLTARHEAPPPSPPPPPAPRPRTRTDAGAHVRQARRGSTPKAASAAPAKAATRPPKKSPGAASATHKPASRRPGGAARS
jgi:hypothetical protein